MIAFSELFQDDVIMYAIWEESYEGKDSDLDHVEVISFWKDGAMELRDVEGMDSMGECAQMSDEDILKHASVKNSGYYKFNVITDETGNNTKEEMVDIMTYDPEDKDYDFPGFHYIQVGYFSGHVTIYDSSYMMFVGAWYDSRDYNHGNCYYFIRDTEDTIDKTVYLDQPSTEGIYVDVKEKDCNKMFEDEIDSLKVQGGELDATQF